MDEINSQHACPHHMVVENPTIITRITIFRSHRRQYFHPAPANMNINLRTSEVLATMQVIKKRWHTIAKIAVILVLDYCNNHKQFSKERMLDSFGISGRSMYCSICAHYHRQEGGVLPKLTQNLLKSISSLYKTVLHPWRKSYKNQRIFSGTIPLRYLLLPYDPSDRID